MEDYMEEKNNDLLIKFQALLYSQKVRYNLLQKIILSLHISKNKFS